MIDLSIFYLCYNKGGQGGTPLQVTILKKWYNLLYHFEKWS